ncbi:MAG: NAD-dependent succinate-semialdehyde dehydrogenase [Halobacteria archaeon]|nr:NAD-dependent succinate-semialdehyde dehydrogenase [Halobacteria archaeon]
MALESVNPATGETIKTFDEHDSEDVDRILDHSAEAFEDWSDVSIEERESLMADAADVLRDNKKEYAEVITNEMGKPITQSVAEVEKCAWVCDYYAENASQHLQDDVVGATPGTKTYISYEPLGSVLAVMPWNFPFWQVFRFAAPTLTAGNTGLLKHSSNVPGCARAIEEVFEEAGFPDDVFRSLMAPSSLIDGFIGDDRIKAVTLTGSERAGRTVAETAGRNLKKTVLELGGSDPFVVLDDADLDQAAEKGASARNQNSGQSCIAAKRFIVVEDVYDEFVDRLRDEMGSLAIGDPIDDETEIGPQARQDLMESLHQQVEASVEAGAELHLGGEPLDRDGFYYPPTLLTDVPEHCPAADEEVFGPVAAVFEVADEEEALEMANDSNYGLGASIWTRDKERGERIAHEIEAGCVFVNELTKSDPRLPFGGVKDSGYGRELSEHGIREFVNRKTVWID